MACVVVKDPIPRILCRNLRNYLREPGLQSLLATSTLADQEFNNDIYGQYRQGGY
jgi:hypothetical protein